MESDEMIPKGKDIDLDAQLDEVAELPPPKKGKTELNVYKRRTSTVWHITFRRFQQKMKNGLRAHARSVERNILLTSHMLGLI